MLPREGTETRSVFAQAAKDFKLITHVTSRGDFLHEIRTDT